MDHSYMDELYNRLKKLKDLYETNPNEDLLKWIRELTLEILDEIDKRR